VTRDHTFHPLVVARVVPETADAASFVLDVPDELQPVFAYEAGQFCNVRVHVDGIPYIRCYSMSSAPALGEPLQVTVKRVPNGIVSNWMIDHLAAGAVVDVAPPTGFFQLGGDGPLVAFAAGSGITPVFSLVKTALSQTDRPVHLLYANRDADSIIFAEELAALVDRHLDRLCVLHHLDVDHGFIGHDGVRAFANGTSAYGEFYVCGPGAFMDIVESALLAQNVGSDRIHLERFTTVEAPVAPPDTDLAMGSTRVTVELEGRTEVGDHRAGTTILQTARQLGMAPPYSCESGSCATCMARVLEGAVSMRANNALTPDEVEAGWILTCQSVPTTPTVHVVYGYD
jgi:ferredoxin-NADP reductase